MARAISLNPKLIVADEPVSMIDVSLRLSIMNLMLELNKKLGISFVYITHDLSTARYIAQNGRLVVMYLGEIVEEGPIVDVLKNPKHPYTVALMKAVPIPDPTKNILDELPIKEIDSELTIHDVVGCPFKERCLYCTDKCNEQIDYVKINDTRIKCCNIKGLNDE